MVHEKREGFPAIFESLNVSDEPASFHGKNKLFRRSFIPAFKNFFLGKAIKRDIQLYRVKMFGVELKPLFLGKVRRVEGPVPPMGIIVAARPDVNHLLNVESGRWQLVLTTFDSLRSTLLPSLSGSIRRCRGLFETISACSIHDEFFAGSPDRP